MIKTVISQFWKLASPGSQCRQFQCLARFGLQDHRWLSSHCVSTWRTGKGVLWGPFHRVLIQLVKASPSWANCFIMTLPPEAIMLKIKISTYKCGENRSIQSISLWSWQDWHFHSKQTNQGLMLAHLGLLLRLHALFAPPVSDWGQRSGKTISAPSLSIFSQAWGHWSLGRHLLSEEKWGVRVTGSLLHLTNRTCPSC